MEQTREKILVTGGAGFLGLALARALRGRAKPVLYDRLCHDPVVQRRRAAELGVELIEADVCDPHRLAAALDGCSRVAHLASLAGVERVCAQPFDTMRTVLVGTTHLLEACRARPGIARLALVSTSEVYGRHADGVAEEDIAIRLPPGPARWTYAAAKLAAEHLALSAMRQGGPEVVILRPFNVYGPGQMGRGAIRSFVTRALAGRPLVIAGDGSQVRAWCHVDDLVAGLVAALFEPRAVGRVYNLGNPEPAPSICALAEQIVRLSGSPSEIVFGPRPEAEVEVRVPDIARARRELGFAPRVSLPEGLERTIAWYRRAAGLCGE